MQKPAKTLLWISMGIGILYAIVALISMIAGGVIHTYGSPDGAVYGIAIMMYVIKVGIPVVAKIMFAFIIIFSLKENSEKIVTEIIAIVLFSGIMLIPSIIIHNVGSILVANIGNQEALVSYSYMNSSMVWTEFLCNISTVLFIVAVAFSIAYKKVELTDIRRILEEEDA